MSNPMEEQTNSSKPSVTQSIRQTSKPMVDRLNELDLNDTIVEIRNLKFTYNQKAGYLLNDISLTFPRSAIYGFLGPSGCGKSTIIKLIVGRLKPTSGTIKVNGKHVFDASNHIPGVGVGYMPQENALFNDLTIYESLNYFSKIYGLPEDLKNKRIDYLIKFLELPEPIRLVGVLSGGQMRRTSLAIAIIHSPPLLILDEPTVGIDPMLRERIWKHLIQLSNVEKTSILITTHYIEECRRAHAIALMRNGRILVENSPMNLLSHFQTNNLEDVFLMVCRAEDNPSTNLSMPENIEQIRANNGSTGGSVKPLTKPMKRTGFCGIFVALAQKNLIILWRQKLFLIEIILPVFAVILFCLCIGKKPFGLEIAVINEEVDNTSVANTATIGSVFLKQIDKETIDLVYDYKTDELAYQAVKEGSVFGELLIGKNFTKALTVRMNATIYVTNETLNESRIKFFGDLSDICIFQTLYHTLIEANLKFMFALFEMFVNKFNDTTVKPNPRVLNLMVEMSEPIYGSKSVTFRDFVTPGLIILIAFVLAMALTVMSTVNERKDGQLERTIVAGTKMHQIIFAQLAVQMIVLVCQTILVMAVTFGVFEIENKGSYLLIAILLILQGICGMSLGMMISALASTVLTAIMILVSLIVPYLVISGIIWPLKGMDLWAQYLATPMPQTLPVQAMKGIIHKNWNLGWTPVLFGYLSTILWTIVFIIGTIVFNNRRKD